MNQATADQATWEPPIACSLSGEDQRRLGDEIARLFRDGRPWARQLPDGYALRFPGEDMWATRLLTFIIGERACCPFFTFELVFEAGQGAIWLHLRGPAGTTEFVAELLAWVEKQEAGQG